MINNVAVYSNLALVNPVSLKGAAVRKATARVQDEAEARFKAKVDQCNRVLDALEELDQRLAKQIKEYQRRRSALASRIDRIQDAALEYMAAAGVEKLTGIRTSLQSRLAPPSLEVVDQTLIPREYLRQPKTPPPAPNKAAIKDALAAREDVQPADWGCKLLSKITLLRK
jgi:Gp157 protein